VRSFQVNRSVNKSIELFWMIPDSQGTLTEQAGGLTGATFGSLPSWPVLTQDLQTDENRTESISPQRFTLLDKINSSSAPFFMRQRIYVMRYSIIKVSNRARITQRWFIFFLCRWPRRIGSATSGMGDVGKEQQNPDPDLAYGIDSLVLASSPL